MSKPDINDLEYDYAKKFAISESNDFIRGYHKRKFKDINWYGGNEEFLKKHQRFINYIYSTIEKYTIHRNIIIYFYKENYCSISVLQKTINISKTSLVKIINESKEEGWLETKINPNNRRQTLIIPTNLRIKFWVLYSKDKYEQRKLAGLDDAHKALSNYYKKKK